MLRAAGGVGATAAVGSATASDGDGGGSDAGGGDGSTDAASDEGSACGPGERPLVITCRLDDSVALMDQATKGIFAEIPVGEAPLYCAVLTDGELAYAPNTGSQDVSVVDIRRREEVARVPLPAVPRGVNVHPETEDAFVEVAGANQVAVIDNETF